MQQSNQLAEMIANEKSNFCYLLLFNVLVVYELLLLLARMSKS